MRRKILQGISLTLLLIGTGLLVGGCSTFMHPSENWTNGTHWSQLPAWVYGDSGVMEPIPPRGSRVP